MSGYGSNDNVVQAITDTIKRWLKDDLKYKFIIGLDGRSGVGKTSIAKQIKQNYRWIEVVHLDCFIKKINQKKKFASIKNDSDLITAAQWYEIQNLMKTIHNFKNSSSNSKCLIVEGILLHDIHNRYKCFDKIIHLQLKDSQVELRNKMRALRNFQSLSDLSYTDKIWRIYKQKYNPDKNSDLNINIRIVDKLIDANK